MFLTPKKILSYPVYGTGTTVGVIATILLVPGGIVLALAMAIYWLADKLQADTEPDLPTTIEEYEESFLPLMDYDLYDMEKVDTANCGNCRFDDACLSAPDSWCEDWDYNNES